MKAKPRSQAKPRARASARKATKKPTRPVAARNKAKPAARSAAPAVTPERISQMAWGYAAPLIIESAVRHHVFDRLESGAKTVEQMSASTGASVRGLRAIMNALVGLQLLNKDRQGRYRLSADSAAFLVSGKPAYLGGLIRHTSQHLIPKWLNLSEVVRTGTPAASVNQQGEGAAFFQEFVEDIFPMSYPAAQRLAQHLDLAAARRPVRVLDLAAGSGVWGIALAQASSQVTVTAVDWPEVLAVTRRAAERMGLGGRFNFVAGDLDSANFGAGHDVATLGHILHSEGAERSQALLRKTHQALAPGGTIAIAEFLVEEGRSAPPVSLIFAVNMLVNTDVGDTFTFGEIAGWLRQAGFVNPRLVEGPGPSPLILATKPR